MMERREKVFRIDEISCIFFFAKRNFFLVFTSIVYITKTRGKRTFFLAILQLRVFFEKNVGYLVLRAYPSVFEAHPRLRPTLNHKNVRICTYTSVLGVDKFRPLVDRSFITIRHTMHTRYAPRLALVRVAQWLLHQPLNPHVPSSNPLACCFPYLQVISLVRIFEQGSLQSWW